MMIRKLAVAVAVVGLVACAAIAQPRDKGAKAEVGVNRTPTSHLGFDKVDVKGDQKGTGLIIIMEADLDESNPLVLTRSFKDALRENVDKETVMRVSK